MFTMSCSTQAIFYSIILKLCSVHKMANFSPLRTFHIYQYLNYNHNELMVCISIWLALVVLLLQYLMMVMSVH